MELPECPKCGKNSKMVPLSKLEPAITGHYPVLIFAEWTCTSCRYTIKA